MPQSVRAVYDNGALRLLDEVQLTEGQQVYVEILSEKERVRAALGDLVTDIPDPGGEEIDEAALRCLKRSSRNGAVGFELVLLRQQCAGVALPQ